MDESVFGLPQPSTGRRGGLWLPMLLIPAALGVVALVLYLSTRPGPPDAATIAAAAGANSCVATGYAITNRLDSSTHPLWDCQMPNGVTKCVTYENNIASDSTAEARFLFASALGEQKPSCLG